MNCVDVCPKGLNPTQGDRQDQGADGAPRRLMDRRQRPARCRSARPSEVALPARPARERPAARALLRAPRGDADARAGQGARAPDGAARQRPARPAAGATRTARASSTARRCATCSRCCGPARDITPTEASDHDDPVRRQSHAVVLRRQPEHGAADLQGHDRPGRDRHPQALRADRQVHLRPGLPVDRVVQLDASPTSTATRASCCTAATRSSSSPSSCDFLETCYLLLYGELPNAQQKKDFVQARDQPHDGQRADAVLPARLPPRRAPDGGDDRAWSAALSAFYHDCTDINNPQHREISAIRLIAKMPTLVAMAYKYAHRPAVHLPEERAVVLRQLHAHDVRHAVRGVRAERRAGARDRPHLHPARRPRAERVDLDGAAVRLARAPTRSRPSPPASPACGARRTAAPTRRR